MRRVSLVGNSGSGKTTVGAALAARLAVPFIELDSIFHQPGWQPLAIEQFRARVAAVTAGEAWVVDGNYSATVLDLVWPRADTLILFDLPRATVMRQVLLRTLRRTISRAELWNGNREPFTGLFRVDPNRSIVRWAWTRHEHYHRLFGDAVRDPKYSHLSVVRIGSRTDANRLLAQAGG
jgi:adenylate kinase family enzyme